jgi:hypothetical protein
VDARGLLYEEAVAAGHGVLHGEVGRADGRSPKVGIDATHLWWGPMGGELGSRPVPVTWQGFRSCGEVNSRRVVRVATTSRQVKSSAYERVFLRDQQERGDSALAQAGAKLQRDERHAHHRRRERAVAHAAAVRAVPRRVPRRQLRDHASNGRSERAHRQRSRDRLAVVPVPHGCRQCR